MINQINKKITFLKTVVSAILGVSSLYIIDWLTTYFGEIASIILLVLIIVLITLILEELLLNLINKSQNIRRYISKDDYIEGIWIDKTINPAINKIITISIFKIFYEYNEIKYHGEMFDDHGETVGTFKSTSTKYDNHTLFSSYEAKITLKNYPENNISGSAEYVFVAGKKYPESFHGIAIDNLEGKRRVIKATRVLNKKNLSQIDDQHYRRDLVLKILNK